MSGSVEQPAGEVTLVFSDIEGSTKLLEEFGTDDYREALAEHRRIVRKAYGRYAGYEVDYEGDAFFYAFSSAKDAITAVSEAMSALEEGPNSHPGRDAHGHPCSRPTQVRGHGRPLRGPGNEHRPRRAGRLLQGHR